MHVYSPHVHTASSTCKAHLHTLHTLHTHCTHHVSHTTYMCTQTVFHVHSHTPSSWVHPKRAREQGRGDKGSSGDTHEDMLMVSPGTSPQHCPLGSVFTLVPTDPWDALRAHSHRGLLREEGECEQQRRKMRVFTLQLNIYLSQQLAGSSGSHFQKQKLGKKSKKKRGVKGGRC